MKKISTLLSVGSPALPSAAPALAGPFGLSRSYPVTHPDPAAIAELQKASQTALREGREGNKNNPAFTEKSYEDEQLISDLESGQQIDPKQITDALQPVEIW